MKKKLLFLFLLFSTSLFAEEEITLKTPPKLLEQIKPILPKDAFYPSELVTVIVDIEVSEIGTVNEVLLKKGAGSPFDEATLEAVRRFRFTPAVLSNGGKTPVTITFQMKFTKPKVEKAPVIILGTLLERGTRKPIQKTNIVAKAGEKILGKATSNENGFFKISARDESFTLFALPSGYQQMKAEVIAKSGESREEVFYLEAVSKGFETIIRSDRIKREVTKRIIGKDTIKILAGTSGDTLKVVENLPGVARSGSRSANPILRGASPDDSKVYLEGQVIPLLYHFGSLRSTFSSTFLKSVEFIPGNFSAYYGRATGGVIDVKVRDLADDMFRGTVDLNMPYDASFSLEGPVTENLSIGGAFRRSYVDTFLGAVIPEDAPISFKTAPKFYDYQFLMDYKPVENHKFKLIFFGSLDTIASIQKSPSESNPEIRGGFSLKTMFHNLQLLYESKITNQLRQKSSVLFSYQNLDVKPGTNINFSLQNKVLSFRSDWEYTPFSWLRVQAGLDNNWSFVGLSIKSPLRPLEGQPSVPLSSGDILTIDSDVVLYSPAFYTVLSFEPIENLIIDPSIRIDWYRQIQQWTFDPRLMIRYAFPTRTEVKASIGIYQQPPTPDQASDDGGNPDLKAVSSLQTSLGISQEITPTIDIEVTGFYKKLSNVVTSNPEFTFDRSKAPYLNDGTGEIYGLELLLNAVIASRFTGWVSYTFQRSLRKDGENERTRAFDFDQPHILTTLGTYDLGHGWSTGFRFRLVSGNPFTPVDKSVFDTVGGTFIPVYGETNSKRSTAFHQLDIRIDKLWTFNRWKMRLYLDVQNVYNQANPEGLTYNYDYSKNQVLSGLPILPILGVTAEW